MGERNPIFSPEEGDILQLPSGAYVLVDFHDPMRTCFITNDGRSGACDYIAGWSRLVENSSIIQLGLPENWPWHHSHRGRAYVEDYKTHLDAGPTMEESCAYLERRISEEYKVWAALGAVQ